MRLTEQNFQNLVSYWVGRLNLPLPLFRRDNRIKYVAYINYCENCKVFNFVYNFDILKDYDQAQIANVIFHELGHIKYYKKSQNLAEEKKEYIAEKFALNCIKKYYPDYLKKIIKFTKEFLNDEDWCKEFPIYVKAFKRIKEYK